MHLRLQEGCKSLKPCSVKDYYWQINANHSCKREKGVWLAMPGYILMSNAITQKILKHSTAFWRCTVYVCNTLFVVVFFKYFLTISHKAGTFWAAWTISQSIRSHFGPCSISFACPYIMLSINKKQKKNKFRVVYRYLLSCWLVYGSYE